MSSIDEDRRRRLRDIEVQIQDPPSIIYVDCHFLKTSICRPLYFLKIMSDF